MASPFDFDGPWNLYKDTEPTDDTSPPWEIFGGKVGWPEPEKTGLLPKETDSIEQPAPAEAPAPKSQPRRRQSTFAPDIESAIEGAAGEHGVDSNLLRTFARIESGGRPDVRTGSYKGLFQLSDEEFRKYGGTGDIFDPAANARAAAIKLRAETEDFKRRYGREPTPVELYMVHQQGVGGADMHFRYPDEPAWKNMLRTAEGRRKGERWAKQAIWGNVPDDVKARFGSVENITSRQFLDLWREKVERLGGVAVPAVTPPTREEPSQGAAPQDSGDLLRSVLSAPKEQRRQIVEDYLYRTLGIPKPQQAQAEVPPWEMFADDTPPWELYGDETAEPEAPAEEQQRGDSFLEGITDPQQYLEFGKGILPGAVSFGGTVLQAPDVFGAAAQRNAAAFGRQQLEVMDRIDRGETVPETEDALGYQHMTPEQRRAIRAEVEKAIASFSPTPIQERPFFRAGEAVREFAEGMMPAAPGYEESVGRQLGEGVGSLVGGLPFGLLGRLPAGAAFGAAGIGEATQRAVEFDRAERAAGRPGLTQDQIIVAGFYGVGPGLTDIVPLETLLGRIPVPIPKSLQRPLARAIARIGGQAFIEGVQEGGQEFLQNLIAREVYDPSQQLIEGVGESAGIGAGVGAIAQTAQELGSWILKAAGGRRARKGTEERREEPPTQETPAEPTAAAEEPAAAPSVEEDPPAVTSASPPSATAEETAILRAQGWSDEAIAEMDPEERAAHVEEARAQGITAPPQELAPDRPSAEPIKDLVAQARDLVDPQSPRRALYLSRDNLEMLLADPEGARELASITEDKTVSLDDFDDQGGMLVVPDDATAQWAVEQKESGRNVQEIIGELTGAGRGKPAEGSAVVQQVTPEGAVTRESLVTPEQVEPTVEAFQQPGRDVRVVPPEEALRRREEEIAAEQVQAPVGDGSREKPVRVQTPDDIERAAERVQEPTEAQAEAGNYRKGHVQVAGLDISIETPKGAQRRGTAPDGTPWEVEMPAHYGYVKRTEGRDGDQVDVYVGDSVDSDRVWVVDQVDADTGRFDEHKAFLGFNSEDEVRAAYEAAFSDGRAADRLGGITEMSVDEFKDWLAKGKRTRPLSELERPAPEPEPAPAAEAPTEPVAAPAPAPAGDIPTFQEIMAVLPEDENGDPDVGHLIDVMRRLTGKPSWNQLTDQEKISVWGEITGEPMPEVEAEAAPEEETPQESGEPEPDLIEAPLGVARGPRPAYRIARRLAELGYDAQSAAEVLRNGLRSLDRNLPPLGNRTFADWLDEVLSRVPAGHVFGVLSRIPGRREEEEPPARKPRPEPISEARPKEREEKPEPEEEEGAIFGIPRSPRPAYRIASQLAELGYDAESGAEALRTELRKGGENVPPLGDLSFRQWVEDLIDRVPAGVVNGALARLPKYEPPKLKTEKPAEPAEAVSADAIAAVRDRLLSEGFKNITEARKFVADLGITLSNKEIEELIESGAVAAARQIVSEGGTPAEIYQRLVELYQKQPNLSTRTGTSVANQAYSTPVPLAYLASRLSGVAEADVVYEPTAGNGALLIEADARRQKITANEIDPARSAELRRQGFTVTTEDATERAHVDQPADAIIMNPPFGAVREGGKSKTWTIDDWTTSQVDHAIALQSLKALKDGGRAVLILGGVKADSIEQRRKGYRGQAKREFYWRLYNNYNVVDHFTVDGDLYARQGAAWPVDVVVIEGRGKSQRALPAAEPPVIYKTWDSLAEKLPDATLRPDTTEARRPDEPVREAPEGVGRAPSRDDERGAEAVRGRPERLPPEAGDDAGRVRGDRDRGEPGDLGRAGRGEPAPVSRGDRDTRRADQLPDTERVRPRVAPEGRQAAYQPASRTKPLDTLIPINMADAATAAMRRLEQRIGSVDEFVAERLGYDPKDLSKYFGAEQIDAIAAAIDNIERESALVLGDQTGIGKGRQVAALLRYAIRQGKTPVLVTEKPDLYGDMWRDMRDIGLHEMLGREPRIFITNTGATVPLDEEALAWKAEADAARQAGEPVPKRRGKFLTGGTAARQQRDMDAIARGEGNYDVVFTTYDQLNTVKGKTTPRRQFLSRISRNALFVFDESHNAGGSGQGGWKAKDAEKNRAEFARDLAADAWGVMFSSATYAKRPDVMDLYARTDMGKAVDDLKMLPELIARGGVPMQQIVASMLADAGQYIRRERSFEGVEYAVEGVKVDEGSYRQFSDAVRAVFQFDLAVKDTREELIKDALDQIGAATRKDTGVGEAAAHTIAFASVMHNLVNQMLLSIKAKAVAQRAIQAIKDGEKPVIGLANTNENFIKDFAQAEGIQPGDTIDLSFRDMLARYLRRTLRVTVTLPDGKKQHEQIPVEKLPPDLQRQYRDALDIINEGEYEGLPISPIDAIRHELTKAGLKVAEVTGRQFMIDYSESPPKYVARPKREIGPAGKRQSIAAFNRGALDVLIINRSGSTGVSMHASANFRDKRRRRMILAQAEPNIDTHLQMLGRVHRTGQVVPPAYSQIAAEIPAEARPTAVLMKKMASLNANTTGARGSVFMADAVDFINEVGDRAVAQILEEDPEIEGKLGNPLKTDSEGRPIPEDAARRVTGRLTLLSPEEQADLLDRITKAYNAEIEQLDSLGENPLEAKTLDLQARTLESTEIKPKQGDSPFLDAVRLEKVSVKAQGRAMSPDEVAKRVAEFLKEKPDGDPASSLRELESKGQDWARATWREYREKALNFIDREVAQASDQAKQSTRARLDENFNRWKETLRTAYPGARVRLSMPAGDITGIVTKMERTGKAKNPIALGSWEVRIAVPDSAREYIFPMSKLFPPGFVKSEDEKGAEIAPDTTSFAELLPKFEEARREGRETRFMFTGNILAAYDQTMGRGRIINYTTETGEIRPGILMGREFDAGDFMASRRVRFQTGEQVAQFFARVPEAEVKATDGLVTLRLERDGLTVTTPAARATGGRVYTDPSVRRAVGVEFVRRGNEMVARDIPTSRIAEIVDAIRGVGVVFETRESQDIAQEIISATPSNPAVREFASAVEDLKQELGVQTRPLDPDAPSARRLRSLIDTGEPSLKQQVAQIRRGQRLKVVVDHIAGYNSEANRVLEVVQKNEKIDIETLQIADLQQFLSSLNDLVQIVEDRLQKGYVLAGDVEDIRSMIASRLDEVAQDFDAISADAEELKNQLTDKSGQIDEALEELRGPTEEVEVEEEEPGSTALVMAEPQPRLIHRARPPISEEDSALDILEDEKSTSLTAYKTLEEQAREILALDISEMDEANLERVREKIDDIAYELVLVQDWTTRMSELTYQRADEAIDFISELLEKRLTPTLDNLETAQDDLAYRLENVSGRLTDAREIEAGQFVEIDGQKIGLTRLRDEVEAAEGDVRFWEKQIARAEAGELPHIDGQKIERMHLLVEGHRQRRDQLRSALERFTGERGGSLRALFDTAEDIQTGRSMRRSLDELGYYSQALEAAKALKQAKGTPQQMLAQLKSSGVKDAEIKATGLDRVLEGKKSVTRDEIVRHLEENRVRLREVVRSKQAAVSAEEYAREAGYGSVAEAAEVLRMSEEEFIRAVGDLQRGPGDTKWSNYTLDPDNPTYRETVLHLPDRVAELDERATELERQINEIRGATDNLRAATPEQAARYDALFNEFLGLRGAQIKAASETFQSGHFPEPNIIGHLMTSLVKDDKGNTVYLIDQIQSDWGQRIRDEGARDEAKIAELEARLAKLNEEYSTEEWAAHQTRLAQRMRELPVGSPEWFEVREQYYNDPRAMIQAEIATLRAATPPHPLVNTTDQWVNTTLRRAIRQAVEADADYIAIPHGDTVLSYNPGDEAGMRGFYGSRTQEGIVPKNLRKLLERIDRSTPRPERVETLVTTQGPRGWQEGTRNPFDEEQTGFTLFRLTDKVKKSVVEEGLPLFAVAEADPHDRIKARMLLRQPVDLSTQAEMVLSVLRAEPPPIPGLIRETVVSAIRPRKGKPDQFIVTVRDTEGNEYEMVDYRDDILRSSAVFDFLPDGSPVIAFFPLDLRGDFAQRVRGERAHEWTHGLRVLGQLAGGVEDAASPWGRLVRHADNLGVLQGTLYDHLRRIGHPRAKNVRDKNATIFETYHKAYGRLRDYRERLDQESVAHMVQQYVHGVLSDQDVAPVKDILDSMLARRALDRDPLRPAMRPEGRLYAFAGERARTADLEALARAKEMEAAGRSREEIWRETGWFKGVDGKWRFEIPDVGIRVRLGRGRLADIVHHPALFEAYPELADIPMKSTVWPIIPAGGAGPAGLFAGGMGKDMRRWVTAHEIQHAIQDIEGFSPGAHPDVVGWDTYQRAAGEVEAVNVGRRSTAYDPQILRDEPPWATQPIPEDEQIVLPSDPAGIRKIIEQAPPERRRELERELTEAVNIVSRIAGKQVEVRFFDQIPATVASEEQRAATAQLGVTAPMAGGFYQQPSVDGKALIGLAFNDPAYDLRTTAGHEAWHHVEMALATDAELRLIRSPDEMARTARLAAQELGRSIEEVRQLPDYEIRAIAFQRYRRLREEGAQLAGIHIGVRRLWDRIIRIFRAVQNVIAGRASLGQALAGAGSTEAIFERARRGELARRPLRRSSATGDMPVRQLSAKFEESLPQFLDRLDQFLRTVVPANVRVRVVDRLRDSLTGEPIAARFTEGALLLEIALRGRGNFDLSQPDVVIEQAMHETVHALRSLGLFDNREWELLLTHANLHVRPALSRPGPGGAPSTIDTYRAIYTVEAAKLGLEGEALAARVEEAINQEVVGRMAQEWLAGRSYPPPPVRGLLGRIRRFFDALWNAASDLGFQTVDDVFERVVSGEVARRLRYSGPRRPIVYDLAEPDQEDGDLLANIIPTQVQPQLTPQAALRRQTRRTLSRAMNALDRARVLVQDRMLPVRRYQEQLETDLGIKLPVNLDAYLAEALYHGRAGERLLDLREKHVEPLLEKMRAAGIEFDEFGDYLYARHAQERNDAIRRINPDNDAGSGMTDGEAEKILKRVAASGKQAQFDELAAIVDDMLAETRNVLIRAGLEERETVERWKAQYKHYVPLRGFEVSDEEISEFPRVGRGFSIRGPEAFRALGRRSKADNPLLYAVQQAQQAIIRAEKNRVLKTLHRQIQAHPDPSIWKVYKGEYRRRVNPETGLIETYWVPPAFVHRENIIGVKIGGKQRWIEIKHPALLRALRGTGSELQGTILGRALFKTARWYAGLLTSYNPEFLFSNFFRDLETALINASDIAEKPEGVRRQIVKDALSAKAIRGAFKALRGDMSSEYAKWFEEFRLAGGKISFLEYNDIDRIRKDIERSLSRGRTMRGIMQAARLVEDLNTAVENGVRLSVYRALREAGVSQDRAAFVARELTVNFNRKGEWGPAINALYLFFNASVQGTTRIAQAVARSKAVRWAVGSIFATGMALDLINYLVAGDDDDGENAYDKIPDWVKERNLIIMLPGDPNNGRVMIPLAYGYNVPYLAGQKMMAVLRGADKPLKAAATVAAAAFDAFNPMGSAPSFAQFVAPTFLDPIVQVLENKTFYGAPIFPTHKPEHQPWSETYKVSAPKWAIEVSRTLNAWTGGNQARSGLLDISPDVLEHYLEFAMGGVGKFVLNAVHTGERIVTGDEWLPEKMPFVRRLYGKSTTVSRRREFYEAWDEVDAAFYEVRELAKDGDIAGSRAARQRYRAELSAYGVMKATAKTLREMRKQKDRIEADKTLSATEKRRRLDELRKRENALIMKALATYAKARQDAERAPVAEQ